MNGWNQKGWQEISVNNDTYIILIDKEHDAWQVLLTNLIELWLEILTDEMILNRAQQLNPLLSIHDFDSNKLITMIVNDVTKYKTEASVTEMKLVIPIEGGVLKFSFNFTKGSPQQFWENVTRPLCVTSMQLMKQNKILLDAIKKKDEEIAEYRAEGAELIRKNIATKVFTEEQLRVPMPDVEVDNCIGAFREVATIFKSTNGPNLVIKKESNSLDTTTNSVDSSDGTGTDNTSKSPEKTIARGSPKSQRKDKRKPPNFVKSSLQSTSIVINKAGNKRKKLTDLIQ